MSKSMLVNVTHVEESRVAIVDDGILTGYEIETVNRTSVRGNIYNAVVDGVHPSLEAAFLRIEDGTKGFLPLDEVNFKLLPARGERKGSRIAQHLQSGQRLMVQVTREPFAGKPSTVTTYFSLPGRFLVLMPGVDSAGVSRKIEDASQRDRLKTIVEDLKVPEGFGVIVRTAGSGQTKTELQRDMRYLLRLWESIQKSSRASSFPGPVYREADLVIRTIRDYFTPDIEEVWIDSDETYQRALQFVHDVMPKRTKVLRAYDGERPLFNRFNLEEQIERIYKRRVPLPSGGEIVIDGTEAMTAIDVNSARSRRSGDLEETILQTNLEAAAEIARQLRLRDLGGLVVIDFIDMSIARNRLRVERAMRDALKGDRARHDVTKISKLGLMELSRERLKGEKMAASYISCPDCDGHGLVKTIEAAGVAAFRKLHARSSRGDLANVQLFLPPEVATWLSNHKRAELREIERRHAQTIEVLADPALRRHENRFLTTQRPKDAPRPAPPPPPPAAPEPAATERATQAEPESAAAAPAPAREEETETPSRPRRRSRRRGSGASRAREKGPEAESTPESTPGAEPVRDPAPDATPAGKEEAEGGDEPRPRRRRRRRRSDRPERSDRSDNADQPERSNQPNPTDGPGRPEGAGRAESPDGASAPPPATRPARARRPAEDVPTNVRSDELMPAAIGDAEGQAGRPKRASRPRGGRRKRRPTS